MTNFIKIISLSLIVLVLASCGNENSQIKPSNKKKCKKDIYENSPVSLYIGEYWFSEMGDCLTSERKKKIEDELYSIVKKIPAKEASQNLKYYKYLTMINPENDFYKKKIEIYENKIKQQTGQIKKQQKSKRQKQRDYLNGLYSLKIPSDPNAKYAVLEIDRKGSYSTIVTKRVGKSGLSFSKRIYNCSKGTVKYLGYGQSIEKMENSIPDANMGIIINKSIAYYLRYHACKNSN